MSKRCIKKFRFNYIFRTGSAALEEFKGIISPQTQILDIGCGAGITTCLMAKMFAADVVGIDIANFLKVAPEKYFKFLIYDGMNIPFADDSFNTVTLFYVLHHCREPLQVLEEAIRVAKDTLVIVEEVDNGWVAKISLRMVDFISSKFQHRDMPTPFNFRPESEWEKVFRKYDLRIIKKKELLLAQWYKRYRKFLWVLQKD